MTNYERDLFADLQDPEIAAAYVDDALRASPEEFLIALRDVAESRQMSKVAESANLNRVSMYRMLAGTGNPRLSSLMAVLNAVDLQLKIDIVSTNQPNLSSSDTFSARIKLRNRKAAKQTKGPGFKTTGQANQSLLSPCGHAPNVINISAGRDDKPPVQMAHRELMNPRLAASEQFNKARSGTNG